MGFGRYLIIRFLVYLFVFGFLLYSVGDIAVIEIVLVLFLGVL